MIRESNPEGRLAIFMDNLYVHKTKEIVKTLEDLNMLSIFSVPYSPQFNGIESYWFLVKQYYKKQLIQRVIKK